MILVFASNNKNKLKEMRGLLAPGIKILSLTDVGCIEEIEETETTLEGNARLKANYITEKYGYNCFADDTGLEVDALRGAPGVYSARFAGKKANSSENMQKLLIEMRNNPNRKSQFRTVIALNMNSKQYVFEGICKGDIMYEEKGVQGFGYDPIFKPDGFDISFAEMSLEEKGKISHRAIASSKLIDFLKKI